MLTVKCTTAKDMQTYFFLIFDKVYVFVMFFISVLIPFFSPFFDPPPTTPIASDLFKYFHLVLGSERILQHGAACEPQAATEQEAFGCSYDYECDHAQLRREAAGARPRAAHFL